MKTGNGGKIEVRAEPRVHGEDALYQFTAQLLRSADFFAEFDGSARQTIARALRQVAREIENG
jgi:hypothetical protein